MEKKNKVSSYFEKDSLPTQLKLLPTKYYFLAVTEFLGKANDAHTHKKKTPANPFEVLFKF